MAVLTLILS